MKKEEVNRRLGYANDARLLIVNLDDFGMCNAVNEAIMRVLQRGLVRSTSLMVPCPWANHAMRFLSAHPEIPFGVHLTALSDAYDYYWGPVTPRDKVPSLLDDTGFFYNFDNMGKLFARVQLGELELEFRAQIEAVLAAGLKPDHLDWHSLRLNGRKEIIDVMLSLAREYRLPLRAAGLQMSEYLLGQELLCASNDFVDSYLLNPVGKSALFARMLRELPTGLTEWAVHPGLDTLELAAMEPTSKHERQTDYDFWASPEAEKVVQEEGIILVDYRAIKTAWARGQ